MSDHSERAKEIFLEAIEKHGRDSWPSFLNKACGGDIALRASVERLLRAQAELGTFQDGPPPPVGSTEVSPTAEITGTVIGVYKLLEQIGEGGMGIVWMAQQSEPVKRTVALKLIKSGMDSKQFISRFEAERQALALMDHPNIARVLDAGATSAGRPYLVMELVRGVPITRYCDEHQLTPRQRLELFVPVCQAIQHAHQKGVIHRDLKPSNVLVARYDDHPVPKVIDFGVAKAAGQPLTEHTLVTGFSGIVGTLEYMSPEQSELNQLDIDTRSDVYALGVLLYELLVGSPPFTRKELANAGLLEMLRVIREQEPSKPSAKLSTAEGLPTLAANRGTEPLKLTRLIRGELDWIVMKALEKDRNCRYDTAAGFAMDIERYLADEPVLACPPSTGYRLRKFARRYKSPLCAATAILVALLASLTFALVSKQRVHRALEDRNRAFAELATQQNRTAEALHKETDALRAQSLAMNDLRAAKEETEQVNSTLANALEREQRAAYRNRIALAHREWLANNPDRSLELLNECPERYRHWEWRFLFRLHHTDLQSWKHAEQSGVSVEDVAFSPDGERIASVGLDNVARIWEVRTGRLLNTLEGHTRQLRRVVFSPDGNRLATAGFDGGLRIWDAATGKEIVCIARSAESPPTSLAFTADGRGIVCTDGAAAKIWDAGTGEETYGWQSPVALTGATLSRDGKWMAACGGAAAWLIEPATNKVVELNRPPYEPARLIFSRDSTRLAAAGAQGVVKIWSVPSAGPAAEVFYPGTRCGGLDFSHDGNSLAIGISDNSIRIVHTITGDELTTLHGHAGPVLAAAFSPSGRQLAAAGGDGTIRIWDATAPQEGTHLFSPIEGLCLSASFSVDSQRLRGLTAQLVDWDLVTGQLLSARRFDVSPGTANLSPDGRHLAGHLFHAPRVFEAATGAELTIQLPDTKIWNRPAFSPDGRLLAMMTMPDGIVEIRDTESGRLLHSLTVTRPSNTCVAFSPDGKLFAMAGVVPNLRVWEVNEWRELYSTTGHSTFPRCLAFSSDSRLLATGGTDRKICVWDAATGASRFSQTDQSDVVEGLCFSGDNQRLFTCGLYGSLNVWDVPNQTKLLTLHGQGNSIALSRDDSLLASCGVTDGVQVWDTRILARDVRWRQSEQRASR